MVDWGGMRLEIVDFIYSIGAGILGGFVVLLYSITYNKINEKRRFCKVFLLPLISMLFFILIIPFSLIILS